MARAENVGGDGSGVNYQAECRQLEDRLGLSPKAAYHLNFRLIEPRPDLAPVADIYDSIPAESNQVGGAK